MTDIDIFEQLEIIARLQCELSMRYLQLARKVAGVEQQSPSPNVDLPTQKQTNKAPTLTKAAQEVPPPPFYIWLIAKQNKRGKVAEVAKRIVKDNDFPKDERSTKQTAYLGRAGYPADLRKAFSTALVNYRRVCARYKKQQR